MLFFFFIQNIYIATALVNHLLTVSHADDLDADDSGDKAHLIETNIAGFLVV